MGVFTINTKAAAAITFGSVAVSTTPLTFTQLPNIVCDEVIFSGSGSASQAAGSLTAAGIAATLAGGSPPLNGYTVTLDGSGIATAALSVSIQVLDPSSGLYQTPASIGNPAVTNPVSVPVGGIVNVEIPTAWPGIQINVPSFGTSTGTFRGVILATGNSNLAVAGAASPGNNYIALPSSGETPIGIKTAGNASNLWVANVAGNGGGTLGFMTVQYKPVT